MQTAAVQQFFGGKAHACRSVHQGVHWFELLFEAGRPALSYTLAASAAAWSMHTTRRADVGYEITSDHTTCMQEQLLRLDHQHTKQSTRKIVPDGVKPPIS